MNEQVTGTWKLLFLICEGRDIISYLEQGSGYLG